MSPLRFKPVLAAVSRGILPYADIGTERDAGAASTSQTSRFRIAPLTSFFATGSAEHSAGAFFIVRSFVTRAFYCGLFLRRFFCAVLSAPYSPPYFSALFLRPTSTPYFYAVALVFCGPLFRCAFSKPSWARPWVGRGSLLHSRPALTRVV